jgi:hypothetical protein
MQDKRGKEKWRWKVGKEIEFVKCEGKKETFGRVNKDVERNSIFHTYSKLEMKHGSEVYSNSCQNI